MTVILIGFAHWLYLSLSQTVVCKFEFNIASRMRNTLPLSSFPLQALLTFEKGYQPLESLACGFLLLFKCYSLPYTPGKSAQ